MRTTTCRRFSGLLLCMAVGIAGVGLGSALGEPLQNIALGKPYTMLNAGKYPACTDDGDRTDLTDGEIHDGESLWTQKGTVGFSARRDMWITVDLGKVEPIVGAALHTGAGAASVMWPISLSVRVSDDGKAFALAGDLVRMHEGDLPRAYQGYVSHTYRTTELRTRGRYVRFEILVPGEFAFADEVEVYRGDRGLLVAPAGGPPVASEQIKDPDRLTRMGCYRRIRSDLENVRALVRHASPEDADSLIARLDRVQAKLEESRFPADVASFRAIVPFNNLHAEVFRVYSRLLPPRGESGISLWHTPRYRMLSMFEEPGEAVSELTITMGQNERRAEVLNVTNTSDRAGTLRFGIVGLPGGTNPDYIRPHQVEYVDGREGEVIASALVPLEQRDGSYETAIASGMTRQIWISADWPQVAPGDYNGKIILSWGNFDDAIDLILSVAPVRLPDRLDCSLGMWDYVADINQPRYGVSPRNRPDAIRDMVEHKVNVVWGEWASIPQIKARSGVGKQMWDVDEEGNLVAEIDYTGWDAFVRMWPDADHYLLSHSFRVDQPFCGQEQGSEAFNRAVSQFAAMWAEHNRQIGLRPGQAGMLFFDEPSDQATYRTTYLFARAFKAGTDEILVFTDPGIGTDMKNKGGASLDDVAYARQALEMCDILCPNLSNTYLRLGEDSRASFRRRQEEGKLFWFYQCHGPTRLGDPSYFRLQAWHALRHGATGVNFWSYSSLGAMNGWKEYPGYGGRTDAPPYFGPETVTTSKHWEAVLESRQDYQYVKILRDRVGELSQAGVESPDLVEARRLAEDLAADVLEEVDRRFGRWYWSERTGNPSAIAEEGRLRVLEMLARLSDGGG